MLMERDILGAEVAAAGVLETGAVEERGEIPAPERPPVPLLPVIV